jgi:hypothetical protein
MQKLRDDWRRPGDYQLAQAAECAVAQQQHHVARLRLQLQPWKKVRHVIAGESFNALIAKFFYQLRTVQQLPFGDALGPVDGSDAHAVCAAERVEQGLLKTAGHGGIRTRLE